MSPLGDRGEYTAHVPTSNVLPSPRSCGFLGPSLMPLSLGKGEGTSPPSPRQPGHLRSVRRLFRAFLRPVPVHIPQIRQLRFVCSQLRSGSVMQWPGSFFCVLKSES